MSDCESLRLGSKSDFSDSNFSSERLVVEDEFIITQNALRQMDCIHISLTKAKPSWL